MFDPKAIDNLAERIAGAIPPGLTHLKDDVEKRPCLAAKRFGQTGSGQPRRVRSAKAVLAKTRARLEELETRVAALEQRLLQE